MDWVFRDAFHLSSGSRDPSGATGGRNESNPITGKRSNAQTRASLLCPGFVAMHVKSVCNHKCVMQAIL